MTTSFTNEMQKPEGRRTELKFSAETSMAERYQRVGHAVAKYGDLFRLKRGDRLAMIRRDMDIVQLDTISAIKAAIIDRVDIKTYKNKKFSSAGPKSLDVASMTKSEEFLETIPQLDMVYDQPHYDEKFELMRQGRNPGSAGFQCYVTAGMPPVCDGNGRMTAFLDEMNFSTEADRANLIAALLTALLRNHWPGGKPIILVTATKSHAGKDTCLDFVAAGCRKASISYEQADWALETNFSALMDKNQYDMIVIENAKIASSNRVIQSAFIERVTTDPCPVLRTTQSRNHDGLPMRNEFIVGISTNDGMVGEDILNRSMVIHLDKIGDIDCRKSSIGNPRHEYLPQYKDEIAAEARGMIKRWFDAGKPLDDVTVHPCGPWAKTIGGILKVNGVRGFLANRNMHRVSHNPVQNALSTLGAEIHGKWLSLDEILVAVTDLGLTSALIPKNAQEAIKSKEKALGAVLSKHDGSKFIAETDTMILELKLSKFRRRPEGNRSLNPVAHYRFDLLQSTRVNGDGDLGETSVE